MEIGGERRMENNLMSPSVHLDHSWDEVLGEGEGEGEGDGEGGRGVSIIGAAGVDMQGGRVRSGEGEGGERRGESFEAGEMKGIKALDGKAILLEVDEGDTTKGEVMVASLQW